MPNVCAPYRVEVEFTVATHIDLQRISVERRVSVEDFIRDAVISRILQLKAVAAK